MRRLIVAAVTLLAAAMIPVAHTGAAPTLTARLAPVSTASPISHIIVQIDENNSFERILGDPCRTVARATPCNVDPATGRPYDNRQAIHTFDHLGNPVTVTPTVGGDIPPTVDHGPSGQLLAMANKWASVTGCALTHRGGNCFQYLPTSDLQAEVSLIQQGTVADNYHSANPVPSWNGHTDFATAGQLDGFTGAVPTFSSTTHLGGRWACNGNDDAAWRDPAGVMSMQPSCFTSTQPGLPGYQGAYRPSAVQPDVPTLFQDLDAAGVTWRIYGSPTVGDGSYQFSICPAFASCIFTAEAANLVPDSQYFTDAANGTLPAVSFFLPGADPAGNYSQHNLDSILVGENMTARVFNAMIAGPTATSSVFVKTWDDCGCFWTDELDRSTGQPRINGRLTGPRIGAVFAGAHVRAGGTDSTPTDVTSIDAMIESLTGTGPISATSPDGTAYDFSGVFDFTAAPRRLTPIALAPVPVSTRAQLAAHPDNPDDPT